MALSTKHLTPRIATEILADKKTLLSGVHADAIRELRDPALLRGKCARCEFRTLCGGSRARAYALTGDWLAEEPLCSYQPPALAA